MEKKKYVKPAMQVIKLQKHAPLICWSDGGQGGRPSY